MTAAGIKHDQSKPRTDLLSVPALLATSRVLTVGASTYGDRNWEQGLHFGRVYGAALRHLMAWWQGEDRDPETGEYHLAHALCCVMFLLHYFEAEHPDYTRFDDRPCPSKQDTS